MSVHNLARLASELEKQELETPKGVASPQVYAQLLAIYLQQNDLCNAKYLWKRIPASVQTSNPELASIWAVGQKMWKRNLPATYQAIASVTWTEPVADIMKALEDKVRERAIALIAQVYSSVSVETVSLMTGLPVEKVLELCKDHNWAVQDGGKMIIPARPQVTPAPVTSSEDQLFKLTEFVSFLEN